MPQRPKIHPNAVAEITGAVPARVRKRLDKNPNAANQWDCQKQAGRWEISAGQETVSLVVDTNDQVAEANAASCSCLLSPKCFHVLACVTALPYAEVQNTEFESAASDPEVSPVESDAVVVSDAMRDAARGSLGVIESVLLAGARASGLVIQSALLRAAHQCRVEGLINLANATIRLAEGIQRLRAGDDHAHSEQLRRDAVAAIGNARSILRNERLSANIIGYVRRPFQCVELVRLHGVIAEPVLTLSGYAGVCVHLQGDDGRLYQIVDLRPGDASLIRHAYRGGIDLGATNISARELSRCRLAVQNLTASPDGRLSKGTKTRWAVRTGAVETETVNNNRFAKPLAQQIDDVLSGTLRGGSINRGGWDLVVCEGSVLGPQGVVVLFAADDMTEPMRLVIAIDDERLDYRRNLELLARCPGLPLRVYGRIRPESAGQVDALSIEPRDGAAGDSTGDLPRLVLPDSFNGRCHLGLDELQRHHVTQASRFASEVTAAEDVLDHETALAIGTSPTSRDLFQGLKVASSRWSWGDAARSRPSVLRRIVAIIDASQTAPKPRPRNCSTQSRSRRRDRRKQDHLISPPRET